MGIYIGGAVVGRFLGYRGDVAEVVMFDVALPAGELRGLECALGGKYDIDVWGCPGGPLVLLTEGDQRVQTGSDFQVAVSGGVEPRIFSVASGGGSVTGSGLFSAGVDPGTSVVRVTDAAGASVDLRLLVSVIPPPVVWLESGELGGIPDGSAVAEWPDVSGHGHHLRQVAASQRPTFVATTAAGFPVVRFDGIDDTLAQNVFPALGDAPRTIAVVALEAGQRPGTEEVIAGYGSQNSCSNAFGLWILASGNFGGGYQCASFDGGMTAMPDPTILVLTHSAAGEELCVNSICSRRSGWELATETRQGLTVGSLFGSAYYAGAIAEVLAFDRALDDDNRAAVETMLAMKYGVSLP